MWHPFLRNTNKTPLNKRRLATNRILNARIRKVNKVQCVLLSLNPTDGGSAVVLLRVNHNTPQSEHSVLPDMLASLYPHA